MKSRHKRVTNEKKYYVRATLVHERVRKAMLSNLLSEELSDGKPFVFRAGTHDSNSTSVLCFTPKSGSSAWKALLVRALVLQGFSMMNDKRSAHGQKLPYKISRVDTLLTDIYIPKLMFVRHPISRLLSAYLGKGRTGKIRLPGWNRSTGFHGFVYTVTNAAHNVLDPHWELQTEQCGVGQNFPYRFLRVEELGHWYRGVVCQLNLQEAVQGSLFSSALSPSCGAPSCCFVRTADCGCEVDCRGTRCNTSRVGTHAEATFGSFNGASNATLLEQYYDQSLAKRVNAWAHADLTAFGYLPWLPGQELAMRLKPRR